jgi:hypothetical protein
MSKYGKKLNDSLHDDQSVGIEFILIWNAAAMTCLVILAIVGMLTAGK